MSYTERLRERAATSDAAFAEYLSEGQLVFPAHLREASVFADTHERGLILMPRGHAKTTLFLYRAARLIGCSQGRLRVGILTAVDDDAISRSRAIRGYVTAPRFGEIFPWAARDVAGTPWTDEAWSVRGAERALGKDVTCRAMSIRSVRAGARLDVLLADDAVGFQENATAAARETALATYRAVVDPMVVPGGRRWALGTHWHEDDLYAELMRKGWPTHLRRAIDDGGVPLWPQEWPLARLAAKRDEIGSATFDLQYQNDPAGMGGNIIRREWFRYVDVLPPGVRRRAGLDLAASSSQRSDYTALGELCEDDEGNLYVCGSYAARLDAGHAAWLTGISPAGGLGAPDAESPRLLWPMSSLPRGFAGSFTDQPAPRALTALNVESVAYQGAFARELQRTTRLPARKVYPDRDKVSRARAFAARYEAGTVFHLRGAPGLEAYEREAVGFPNAEHDDRLDAMVYAADLNTAATELYWTSGRR